MCVCVCVCMYKCMDVYMNVVVPRSTIDPIYQPLRSGRIWHKVKF